MNIFRRRKNGMKLHAFLCAAITGYILLSSFTACGKNDVAASKNTDTGNILSYKTEYVGDNSKVCSIVNALAVPKDISFESVSLSTKSKPYGVTVNYETKSGAKIDSLAWEYKNAAIMLCLIGNADEITFTLKNASCEKYHGFYSEFHYTRGDAEDILGKDINKYSDSAENFKKFTEKLNTAKFGFICIDIDYAKTKAEQKFKIILPEKLTYKDSETVCGKDCYMFICSGGTKTGTKFAVSTDGCIYFNFSGNEEAAQQT